MTASEHSLLSLRGLSVSFGGIEAVKHVDLDVNSGELVTLVGANGAGKTTTLKAITGTLPSARTSGQISYQGKRIDHQPAHALLPQGLAGLWARLQQRKEAA